MLVKKLVKNFSPRDDDKPEIIVIHIGEGTKEQIYSEFLTGAVSSHYLTCENGEVWQFVEEKDTAWHAGFMFYPTAQIVKEKNKNPNSSKRVT
ncbi:MAG: N-acetylmuramoyl-L-alanine amidase [Bacteroidetes bacterium]|nr:N-acetylmuramoyl-L-alanine amidase [Bacteroidota bacterium]